MTVHRVEVRNFQSLRHVDVELGRFTVIVGPSSSGKTALMRAFRAISSNVRGSSYVTRGEKVASVSVETDQALVTLERGEGHGVYRVTTQPVMTEDDFGPQELTFTKLGGSVPEEVTEFLGLEPLVKGVSVNFAGQFDPPYLLDDSGSEVARVLGKLTRVDVIFTAVREANRRQRQTSAQLKVRLADRAALQEQVASYLPLPSQLSACTEAESLLAEVRELSARHSLLLRSISTYETAQAVLARATLPEVPSLESVSQLQASLASSQGAVRTWLLSLRSLDSATEAAAAAGVAHQYAQDALHEKLREAGQCPTCGQEIHD
jgi:exonuclease SbcC